MNLVLFEELSGEVHLCRSDLGLFKIDPGTFQ